MITLIAAIAENNCIGDSGKLPWYLPEDLKRFKEITTGHTVLMGRKTFESIMDYLGKPLPKRTNIVITRQADYKAPRGVHIYTNIEDALQKHKDEDIYIIGGAQIYEQTLEKADRLLITEVHKEVDGDTFFPEIDKKVWKETSREDHEGYSFVEYKKHE